MKQFNVGDRVRYLGKTNRYEHFGEWRDCNDVVGREGVVVGISGWSYPFVLLDGFEDLVQGVHPNNLQLIEKGTIMRKYIKIKDTEHSKKVQEKLFGMGYEWNGYGKQVSYTSAPILVFNEDSLSITFGGNDWEANMDEVEVVLVEKVSYEFQEVIELNGKKYSKRNLEEALKNLQPLEN